MRALRLMSICFYFLRYSSFVLSSENRPRPIQDPVKLRLNLNKVALGSLIQLKNMNYRHKIPKHLNQKKEIADKEL